MNDEATSSGPEASSYLALGAALLAAAVIPGQPVGANVLLVTVLVAGAVSAGRGRDLNRAEVAFCAAACILMSQFVLRTAQWVLLLDALGAVALAAVGVVGAQSARDMVTAAGRALTQLASGVAVTCAPLTAALRKLPGDRAPLLGRGIAIGSGLMLVFGGLFVSADRAFASIARDVIVPEIDIGLIPGRVAVGLAIAATAGALLVLKRRAVTDPQVGATFGPEIKKLDAIEWIPGIVLLDLLFVSFAAVQITVLFGGNDHVLATEGLTYAKYARQGFFQLVAVVVLTIGVIAAVVNLADLGDRRMRRLAQWTLGLLCSLTFVILLSAYVRLDLYEQTYGFTRLRLSVHATILWLAVILLLVVIAGARWKADWLARTVVAVTAVGLVGFNLLNPDLFIARRNIERFHQTGQIDPYYLGSLSLDAVPALVELQEPMRSCVLGPLAARSREQPSIWSFNFARAESRQLLRSLLASTGTCPS